MTNWLDGTSAQRAAYLRESLLTRGANPNEPGYAGSIQAALDAAAAGRPGPVFVPAGTYVGDLTVPAGTVLWGAGRTKTIIQGRLNIASNAVVRDLRCGDTGVRAVTFQNNADRVLIENVHCFGGSVDGTIQLNDSKATNIAFVDCLISGNTSGGNGVAIVDRGTAAKHYENITFTRCHFKDNDRINFEVLVRYDGVTNVTTGYRNINLIDCILDQAGVWINVSYDSEALSDASARAGGYSTIRGCTITGGEFGIEIAGSMEMLIEGNTVKDTNLDLLSMSAFLGPDRSHCRIIGNSFSGDAPCTLNGQGNVFSGNEIVFSGTSSALRVAEADDNVITGNNIETAGNNALSIENGQHNSIVGNRFYGGSNQVILVIYAGSEANWFDSNYIVQTGIAGFSVLNGTTQHFGYNIRNWGGTIFDDSRYESADTNTYGATIAPWTDLAFARKITVTNTSAITMDPPVGLSGAQLTLDILNSSGGAMGTITWNSVYKMAGAWVNPANGKRRLITFYRDGATNWIEMNRSAADVG